MEEATNKNYPSTTEDLISAMENGEYKHLQIFLFRNEPKYGFGFNEKYLVVNHNGFALYKLTDLKYDNGNIIIAFHCCPEKLSKMLVNKLKYNKI